MNHEQRKFLKGRMSACSFRWNYNPEKDSLAIKKLKDKRQALSDQIDALEEKASEKWSKVEKQFDKVKNAAFELVYGKDFEKALDAVKAVEKRYEELKGSANFNINQQTHGEICPHYAEGQLENCDKVSMCLCDGKLSPC